MKKRMFAMVLAVVMLLSAASVAYAVPGTEFKDVQPGDWFYGGVEYAYKNGLMNGTGDSMFSPNQSTTRGMIVTIIHRMEDTPEASDSNDFADVPAGAYFEKAVAWAAAEGIVTGYSNVQFGPNDTITRQQLAAILFRYAGTCGYDISGRADLNGYRDVNSDYGPSELAGWAADAMAWAVDAGLITGTDAVTLSPNGFATRAQVAIILMRFCEKFSGTEEQPGQAEPKPESPVGPGTPSGPSTPVTPEEPEVDVPSADSIGYEEFNAMPAEEQQKFMESFDSIEGFFAWYNEAKAKYDADREEDRIEVGEDGNINFGDILNGKS